MVALCVSASNSKHDVKWGNMGSLSLQCIVAWTARACSGLQWTGTGKAMAMVAAHGSLLMLDVPILFVQAPPLREDFQ